MNKTAAKITAAAEGLFKKFGTRRVTIDEICRSAGISKMTFYKYYPNKIELAKTILRRLADAQLAAFHDLMSRDIPFEEKVRETIRMKLEAVHAFGDEWPREYIENPDSEIGRSISEMAVEISDAVRREYEEAQKKGDVRSDIRMDFILYFLDHTQQMFRDERLLSMYDSIESLTAEVLNFFFWGILPRKPK